MAKGNGSFDYLIVGAGTAGCTLASRLSEDAGARVLLIEAGGWDRDPWIRIPLGWGKILRGRLHDWDYFAEPQPGVNERAIECARGKVIGGTSSINAMAHVRGHSSDYDRWAYSGLKTWSYAHTLPYFRRQESWVGGESVYRGGSGPLTTSYSRYVDVDPLITACMEAGVAAGYPRTEDYNAAQQEGFGLIQATIRNGRRCSAADAYLKPALRRPNLQVLVKAHATRVVIEGNRAVGVEYIHDGRRKEVIASREVILCGGVINSPQLLMLSGIGDPAELLPYQIPVRIPLKGVGKNLQDHVSAVVSYRRKDAGPLHKNMRIDRIALALARAYLLGTGFATDLPSGWVAFLKTKTNLPAPDIQLLFNAGSMAAKPYLPPFSWASADSFSFRPVLLRPESRGSVSLRSADPGTAPCITPNLLSTDHDLMILRDGVRMVREIARQGPLQPFIAAEMSPGAGKVSDADIDTHIRATSMTVHHPLGTCKMGLSSDAMAVVDEELRVLGVDGLRVVDAAVMPDLIGGNINAAVGMIAERAADIIRGRPTLLPADVHAHFARGRCR